MQHLIFLKNLEKKRHLIFLKILIVSSIWLVKDAWIKPRCLQVVQQDLLWVPGYEWLWWCRHFSFSKIVININQSIQSINSPSISWTWPMTIDHFHYGIHDHLPSSASIWGAAANSMLSFATCCSFSCSRRPSYVLSTWHVVVLIFSSWSKYS